MKNTKNLFALLLFVATFLVGGLTINAQDSIKSSTSEFDILVNYLETTNNFVKNGLQPAIVTADEIKENVKNKKYLVIDIRSQDWFEYGHIKNAVNLKAADLLNYFENDITPTEFDKITVVCYSGQSAAYFAGLLRLYGYDNVYSLMWGMSSWDEELATNIWVKNTKQNHMDVLETTANTMPEKGATPLIKTGNATGEEILKARVREAFTIPYSEFIAKTPDVLENPSNFFIVNYTNEDVYKAGHITGAINYLPKTDLMSEANLFTLPTDKKVVINCLTGQSAAYAVAYLNILGYDVANLAYGANSYMNPLLLEKGWYGFSSQEIKGFPLSE